MLMPTRSIVLFAAICALPALRAEVHCPATFSDHMVLQRDQPVTVWGEANPDEKVTVEFAGHTASTTTPANGRWRVELPAMAANADARTMTVKGADVLTFSDVVVGEVWLCSGQSNMEKPLGPRKGQKPTDNYEEEVRHANHPLIRLYQMPPHGRPNKKILGLKWVPCTPATIVQTDFSAAAYYFGRELRHELGVPIGLIDSSFGGTNIEAWIPDRGFATHPAIRDLRHATYQAWVKGVQATELYESMIAPLVPYSVRGFLWYQGENNCMRANGAVYTEEMRALIDSWRTAWGESDAPWYFVQLAPFDYSQWTSFPELLTPEELPLFWEAQTAALAIPHTGMVVTTDLVKNLHDIHPTDKRDVGLRLARLALAETYGKRELLARSPSLAGTQRHDGKLVLQFRDAGAGLRTRDGKPATDFVVAGDNHRFMPAEVVVEGDRVIVSNPDVKNPVAVRFGWNETATPNLVNSAGLPAIPFRTDAWPVEVKRPRPLVPIEAQPTKEKSSR